MYKVELPDNYSVVNNNGILDVWKYQYKYRNGDTEIVDRLYWYDINNDF